MANKTYQDNVEDLKKFQKMIINWKIVQSKLISFLDGIPAFAAIADLSYEMPDEKPYNETASQVGILFKGLVEIQRELGRKIDDWEKYLQRTQKYEHLKL
jgi:hypothetical protein